MVLPAADTTPLSFPLSCSRLACGVLESVLLRQGLCLREESLDEDERECCFRAAQAPLPFCLLPMGMGGWLGILVVESAELRI